MKLPTGILSEHSDASSERRTGGQRTTLPGGGAPFEWVVDFPGWRILQSLREGASPIAEFSCDLGLTFR